MIPTGPKAGTLTFQGRVSEIGGISGFDDKKGDGWMVEGAGVRAELDDGSGEAYPDSIEMLEIVRLGEGEISLMEAFLFCFRPVLEEDLTG